MENKVITVTSPLLPSLDEFMPYLQDIWSRKWLTNNGYYHQELEKVRGKKRCVSKFGRSENI